MVKKNATLAFRPDNPQGIRLQQLLRALTAAGHQVTPVNLAAADDNVPEEVLITGASLDSRTVQPGDLYIGLPGSRFHGAQYAASAVHDGGAVAVLTDAAGAQIIHEQSADTAAGSLFPPILVVPTVRDVIGIVAGTIYDTLGVGKIPALFGVTGTNGKTTTSYLVRALLAEIYGRPTGLIGTVETRIGDQVVPSTFTTPEAPELHGLMARMSEEHVLAAVMEVSSHALDYQRVAGLKFAVAGFTNLTQDHLDLHGTMESYAAVKAKLFTPEYTQRSVITLNGGPDLRWGVWMAERARSAYRGQEQSDSVVTLDLGAAAQATPSSQSEQAALDHATWRVDNIAPAGVGARFELIHQPSGTNIPVRIGLPGSFNIANAALAVVMVLECVERENWPQLMAALGQQDGPLATVTVPGRMQVVAHAPTTIVDFAHNPDGMVQALRATHHLLAEQQQDRPDEQPGRTILVFGATGDRDTTKRATMGRIAVEEADIVIVSDDDPHSEDPAQIRAMVLEGAHQAQRDAEHAGRKVQVIESAPREKALQLAVELATPKDVILAAGRGHETHQDINGVAHPLDDREVLRAALKDHGLTTNSVDDRFESSTSTQAE